MTANAVTLANNSISEMKASTSGVTSLCPPHLLSKVEHATGLPIDQMSSATVSSLSKTMYDAVSQYITLFSARESCIPVRVDAVEKPRWVREGIRHRSADSTRRYFEIENSDEDENSGDDDEIGPKAFQRPLFDIGHGFVTVSWPPPAHLSANRLREEEEKLRRERSCETLNNDPPSPDDKEGEVECQDNQVDRYTVYVIAYVRKDKDVDYDMIRAKFVPFNEALVISKEPVRQFLKEVLQWDQERVPPREILGADYLDLYRLRIDECNKEASWYNEGSRRSRPAESVVLSGNTMDMLISDMRSFLSPETKAWYRKHGVPTRRSYLFHGPPGTGKTSTVRVLASLFNRSCCFIGIANQHFSNQSLADVLSNDKLPSRPLLVLEDVDALFDEKRQSKKEASGLSFSGFLNAIDGVLSVDGVITVLTTNHADRLDPALLRAGRVDKKVYFGPPTNAEIERYFKSFYTEAKEETVKLFMDKVEGRPKSNHARSLATLQQLFIACREKSETECAEYVDEFLTLQA